LALQASTQRDDPAIAQSDIASCTGGLGWEDVNFPIKNIPSAPLIYDQVNRISKYNDDAGALDSKISSKIRTLGLLHSIKANIIAHPKPINPSKDSPSNIELKNKLASQYTSIKSQIGRADTIADADAELEQYMDEDYDIFADETINPESLLSKCETERADFASAPIYSDPWHIPADDLRQTLFCAWETSWGTEYTQTRGYNTDKKLEFNCSSWYRGTISDYMGEAF